MTLLAKSNGETLYQHSIITHAFGMAIIDALPLSREERAQLKALASLPLLFHDIGKGAAGFQQALQSNTHWKGCRHEILSACFLSQFELVEEQIFSVITHHKDIVGSDNRNNILPETQIARTEDGFDTGVLKEMKRSFEENAENINNLCRELFKYIHTTVPYVIKLKDGIGIDEIWLYGESCYGQIEEVPIKNRMLASKLRAIIRAADHIASSYSQLIGQVDLRSCCISNFDLRHFQEQCQKTRQDIILVAPTGSGKTEATLLWAQTNQKENARLFYVLPYQASINAMHKRLSDIFGIEKVGVLHSNAISYLYGIQGIDQNNKIEYQKTAQKFAGLAKEIYYPIRICTPHQLLKLGLKGTGWEFLYLEFANALFIYDEIHVFQPIIVGLTLATAKLAKKMKAKLAFVSATFPDFLKNLIVQNLGEFKSIGLNENEYTDQVVLERKRHNIQLLDGNMLENKSRIIDSLEQGRSVLLITNHVRSAQILYEEFDRYQPLLLHSRFTRKDRRSKEAELMSEEKPQLVIATQVIEVSLDINYDIMFTEPAPIDALAQRFGRVNRQGRSKINIKKEKNIFVLNKQISKHQLYCQKRVDDTLTLLTKFRQKPITESDLINITNQVYQDGYTEEEQDQFERGLHNIDIQEFEKYFIAGISKQWVDAFFEKMDASCEVLPLSLIDKYEELMDQGIWVEAKDLCLNVRYSMIQDKICRNLISNKEIYIVNCMYSHSIGLIIDEKPSNFLGWDI